MFQELNRRCVPVVLFEIPTYFTTCVKNMVIIGLLKVGGLIGVDGVDRVDR